LLDALLFREVSKVTFDSVGDIRDGVFIIQVDNGFELRVAWTAGTVTGVSLMRHENGRK